MGVSDSTQHYNMIANRTLAFFALMAVVVIAVAMPQPEAEAEAEAQFYSNNFGQNNFNNRFGYERSSFGYNYPSYYRGYGYGYNGNNNYNNYFRNGRGFSNNFW